MDDNEPPVPPRERECECCGRQDIWGDGGDHWRVVRPGRTYCIHEWDINGTYSPF